MSKPRPAADPPPKKSRSITMALLGAVTLCSCCCCLLPAPNDDDPTGDPGGSNFEEAQEFAADGTPTTGTTARNSGNQTTHNATGRSHYGGPFWLPLFFGSSYSRGSSGPGVNSPSRTPSPGGGVTTGGFGGTGRSMTGGGTGGGSAS